MAENVRNKSPYAVFDPRAALMDIFLGGNSALEEHNRLRGRQGLPYLSDAIEPAFSPIPTDAVIGLAGNKLAQMYGRYALKNAPKILDQGQRGITGGMTGFEPQKAMLPMDTKARMKRAKELEYGPEELHKRGYKDIPDMWYHGTFDDIEEFKKGNPGGWWGGYHYVTSDVKDVNANYASLTGPDVVNKLDDYAAKLMDEWEDAGQYLDVPEIVKQKLARKKAAEATLPSKGVVMPLKTKMKNPAWVGFDDPQKTTWIDLDYKYVDDEVEDFGENYYKIRKALEKAEEKYDFVDPDQVMNDIMEKTGGESVTADDLSEIIKGSMGILEAQNDLGQFVSPEITADVFKELGYDALIMDAFKQFGPKTMKDFTGEAVTYGMQMNPGTMHAILFDPDQLRSIFARFDPKNVGKGKLSGEIDMDLLKLMAAGGATAATVPAVWNNEMRKREK